MEISVLKPGYSQAKGDCWSLQTGYSASLSLSFQVWNVAICCLLLCFSTCSVVLFREHKSKEQGFILSALGKFKIDSILLHLLKLNFWNTKQLFTSILLGALYCCSCCGPDYELWASQLITLPLFLAVASCSQVSVARSKHTVLSRQCWDGSWVCMDEGS